MSPEESDPHHPEQETASVPEDDWGDAMQAGGDEDWGEAALPERRATDMRSAVNVIESDDRIHEQVVETSEDPDEDYVTRHGTVKVREITGSRPKRLKPQKPSIDKMPRKDAAFQRAKNERWDVEDKEWSSVTTFRLRWVLAIAAAGLAVIPLCLTIMSRMNPVSTQVATPDEFAPDLHEPADASDELMEQLLVLRPEAGLLFSQFASADGVDAVLPLLRDAAGVEPLLRSAGHQARAAEGWEVEERSLWSLHLKNHRPYARLQGEFPDFTRYNAYFVLEHGRLVLDWKATTGYCSAPFGQLLRGEGDAREIRGTIVPSNLYTASFPEGEYQCYQLESPDGHHMLWCYVPLESRTAREIARLFIGGGIADQVPGPTHVTLKLTRGKEGTLGNQWLIEELLHEQWIEM